MSDATYTKDYGAIQFYDTSGNLLFDSVETYDLWTSADNEPSPEVKWTRVSVPGADGAVDLSRALAGQVTYEQREIDLQFSGKQADHEAGVAFLRVMRAMLHGARVRIATVLTNLAGGYYVADCECDGTVYPDGAVQIDVHAVADPFIHVGTQSLTLPASQATSGAAAVKRATNSDLIAGAGRLTVAYGYDTEADSWRTPVNATSGKLWYAEGDSYNGTNLFDLALCNVAGYDCGPTGSTKTYASDVKASGHDIDLGTLSDDYKTIYVSAFKRTNTSIADSSTVGLPFLGGDNHNSSAAYVGIYLTGTITAVDSPRIAIRPISRASSVDAHGGITGGVETTTSETYPTELAATTYDDELAVYARVSAEEVTSALEFVFSGITATDLHMRIAAAPGLAGLPDHWPAPHLGYVGVDFGGTFCHTRTNSDEAEITPLGVSVTRNCALKTSGYSAYDLDAATTGTGSVDGWIPEGAQVICFSATNSYGEDCPGCNIACTSYGITTVSGTNGTMRSTPSIVSDNGAYIAIGDQSAVVDAGTVELGEFTLGAGSFDVTYATLGETDATLTWEGGVL